MIQPPPTSAKPPAPRRSARSLWSARSDVRAVQIGVVATILVHVLLLALAPKIEQWMDLRVDNTAPDDWSSKEFQIEMPPMEAVPAEPLTPPKFVEANPNAPDNAPDKTTNVAAQNQQVAQETPTPAGKSDAPASKGDPTMDSTAIVSGQLSEIRPPAPRPPAVTAPETPEQLAARREQNPFAGAEKITGDNPDGIASGTAKASPNASDVPEKVEGSPDAKTDTGARTGLYYKVDAKRPQVRPTLAPNVVKARPSPLANREFGTENIGAVAYDAKWSAYGEYMQKFVESVQIQWERIIDQSAVYPAAGTKVVVKFRMNAKGEIAEIISVESTGGRGAKDACASAIAARSPYGVWPEDMAGVLGESQEITFTFSYN